MKYTFPSGATIEFGHLQNSGSQYQYQGGDLDTFIGIDEAIPDPPRSRCDFLRTRLRRACRLPGSPGSCPAGEQLPGNIGHQYPEGPLR